MARANDGFIVLPNGVFDAAIANARVSPSALKILIALCQRHNGYNNGKITFTARDGERIGIGATTTRKALSTLIEEGFIGIDRAQSFWEPHRYSLRWLPSAR